MKEYNDVTRRDFLGGMALSLAAGTALTPAQLLAGSNSRSYPPALTGMRGSQPGSFETAHALARQGVRFDNPSRQTDSDYDLVVAGGGISGLAAAYFFQQRSGGGKRILVLDNHDDFGGHCRRNEFNVDGARLIGYGGSQSIDSPGSYSPASAQLLKDLAINTDRFYDYFDTDFFKSRKMARGIYFNKAKYGRDVLAPNILENRDDSAPPANLSTIVDRFPVSAEARAALMRLLSSDTDYLQGIPLPERRNYLRGTSYTDFLHQKAAIPSEVTDIFRQWIADIWGVGWDALSTLEAWRWEFPGTGQFGLEDESQTAHSPEEEPYIFHFPDGNAGVASALVRQLVPGAMAGTTMEDLVLNRVDYGALDRAENAVRIRLQSTAVDLSHTPDQQAVDIRYVRDGKVFRVRARHCIFAGYQRLMPHLCSELPQRQVDAINSVTKVPLVYTTVALRNWQAFADLGYHDFSVANADMIHQFGLDFPVSMGGYQYSADPRKPILAHCSYVPAAPGRGLNSMEQHRAGRQRLYHTSFADYESNMRELFDGALGSAGFRSQRDIAAITVNRWPHGYAYEYNELFDDPGFGPNNGPHILGRTSVGRISMANSDSEAFAYLNGAIDAAHRAVQEQLEI